MGRVIFGLDSNLGRIYSTDRGDVSFRIRGPDSYVDVAKVDYVQMDSASGKEFWAKARVAFGHECSSKLLEGKLLESLKSGEISPASVWADVKSAYSLPSDFDVDAE